MAPRGLTPSVSDGHSRLRLRDGGDVGEERRLDRHRLHFAPRAGELLEVERLEDEVVDRARIEPAMVALEDGFLLAGGAVRIAEANLHQKAIELGFGQRIGPLELDRVLRRERGERRREPMARAVDRDLALFHRLEQRRLRPRRHPVDLVDEQQVGEDRPLVQREGARRHVEDVGADDVGGHQVGRALHALELQAHDARERADRQRLGQARNAFEQRVPAADDRQQQQVDHLGLPDDDLGELAAGLAGDLFECAHRLFLPLPTTLEARRETPAAPPRAARPASR